MPGTNLFVGHMPETPDTCAALFLRGGAAPVRTMSPALSVPVVDLPTVQVLLRAATIPVLDALDLAIREALDHWWGVTGSTAVKYCELSYSPVDLGFDENRRPLRSIVFRLMVERS